MKMTENQQLFNGEKELFLYGDATYTHRFGIKSGFSETLTRTPGPHRAFNHQLSSTRMSVEQGMGRSKILWPLVQWKLGLKEGSSPIGAYYRATILLTNCHSCLRHGNQISRRFDCLPPLIERYLFNRRRMRLR